MKTKESRLVLALSNVAVWLARPACRLWVKRSRRRGGPLWVFFLWFHVGLKW